MAGKKRRLARLNINVLTDEELELKEKSLEHERHLTDAANEQRELTLKRLQVVANQNKLLNADINHMSGEISDYRKVLTELASMSGIGPAQKIAREALYGGQWHKQVDNLDGKKGITKDFGYPRY